MAAAAVLAFIRGALDSALQDDFPPAGGQRAVCAACAVRRHDDPLQAAPAAPAGKTRACATARDAGRPVARRGKSRANLDAVLRALDGLSHGTRLDRGEIPL